MLIFVQFREANVDVLCKHAGTNARRENLNKGTKRLLSLLRSSLISCQTETTTHCLELLLVLIYRQ